MENSSKRTSAKPPEPIVLKIIGYLNKAALLLASLAMVALVLNVTIDVILRALTGKPLGLTLELTTFWWMPLLVVLSFSITEELQEHIKVTMLLDRLSDKVRRNVEGVFGLIGTGIVALLAWFATVDAIKASNVGQAANSDPLLPYWQIKIVVAVGMIIFALQTAATTYKHFAQLSDFEDDLLTEADVI